MWKFSFFGTLQHHIIILFFIIKAQVSQRLTLIMLDSVFSILIYYSLYDFIV